MASVRTVVARRYLRCVAFIVIGALVWVFITFLFSSVPSNLSFERSGYPNVPSTPQRHFLPISEDAKLDMNEYLQAKFGNSCYQAKARDDLTQRTLRNPRELERRRCDQQLPHALIIGMRQCGSDRILRYLRFHPAVEVRTDIPIDYSDIYEKGFEWYKDQMPYTSESQITVDKLPNYFIFPEDAPKRVKYGISPDTKLIAVVCDPVRRAVAEYARLSSKNSDSLDDVQSHIKNTFEKSVFENKQPDTVAHLNLLIDNSIYFKHLLSWMRYFPPSQIYVVDGKNLKFNTYNEFRRLEGFLGLPNFYQESHFSFDNDLEAYCLSYPQYVCPRAPANFAPRPKVSDDVKQRLYEFFEPFDRTLVDYFKQNLTWREQLKQMAQAQGQGQEVQSALDQVVDGDDAAGREIVVNQLLQNAELENELEEEVEELEELMMGENDETSESGAESSFEDGGGEELQQELDLLEGKYGADLMVQPDTEENFGGNVVPDNVDIGANPVVLGA